MKSIQVGLIGASGKMGLVVRECLKKQNIFVPFIAVSSKFCSEFSFSVENLSGVEVEVLDQVDVWIDFSNPASLNHYSLLKNKPIVNGVTGFTQKEFQILKKSSIKQSIFWAANFSFGLWAVRQMLKAFTNIPDYDYALTDIHHNQKKDNPSGTALVLHSDLEKVLGKKIAKPKGQRLGGAFGIHEVLAVGQNEMIKVEHTALNREVFAEGALSAALWLMKKKNGFYSMNDMMQSKSR